LTPVNSASLLSIEKLTGQAGLTPVKSASLLSVENLTGQAGLTRFCFYIFSFLFVRHRLLSRYEGGTKLEIFNPFSAEIK
jgi:hypothetical protein